MSYNTSEFIKDIKSILEGEPILKEIIKAAKEQPEVRYADIFNVDEDTVSE